VLYPIVRMYSNADAAANAVAALKGWGFGDDMISVIGPSHGSGEAIVSALKAAFIERTQAKHYASGVSQGLTAVVVRAPFGHGEAAQYHMNSAGPVSKKDAFSEPMASTWDEGAPVSSAFHIPVLSKWRPFGGMPCVTKHGSTLCSKLGLPEISSDDRPTTEKLGLPMLSKPGPALSAFFKG